MRITKRQLRRIIESYYEEDYEEERSRMQPMSSEEGQKAYELGFEAAKLGISTADAKKKAKTAYPDIGSEENYSYMTGYHDAVQSHHFGTKS